MYTKEDFQNELQLSFPEIKNVAADSPIRAMFEKLYDHYISDAIVDTTFGDANEFVANMDEMLATISEHVETIDDPINKVAMTRFYDDMVFGLRAAETVIDNTGMQPVHYDQLIKLINALLEHHANSDDAVASEFMVVLRMLKMLFRTEE